MFTVKSLVLMGFTVNVLYIRFRPSGAGSVTVDS